MAEAVVQEKADEVLRAATDAATRHATWSAEAQNRLVQRLLDVNQKWLTSAQVELNQFWAVCWSLGTTMSPSERARIYQGWLTGFMQRAAENMNYAMEATEGVGKAEAELLASRGKTASST